MLKEILDSIENENMRKFADMCVETIPDYWYHVPASSTGKYHPSYALGDGGLMRHTIALCRIMNHLFSTEIVQSKFKSAERDAMRIAGIMHDTRKSGNQEEFTKNKWTRFEHPILAADVVRSFKGCGVIKDSEIEVIAKTIESHMGQWNTDKRSNVVLPKPENKYDMILHICDYLASRKDIVITFEDVQDEKLDVKTYALPFGKHKGKTLQEIKEEDPSYIAWAKENMKKEPLKSLLKLV